MGSLRRHVSYMFGVMILLLWNHALDMAWCGPRRSGQWGVGWGVPYHFLNFASLGMGMCIIMDGCEAWIPVS